MKHIISVVCSNRMDQGKANGGSIDYKEQVIIIELIFSHEMFVTLCSFPRVVVSHPLCLHER